MTFKIHQLLASAYPFDAITQYSLYLKSTLQSKCMESKIFVPTRNISDKLKSKVIPLNEIHNNISTSDTIMYHYSISSPATQIYKTLNAKKILCYHNITPPEFFLKYSDGFASNLLEGRNELAGLKDITHMAIADSDFNKSELEQMDFKNIYTLPLLLTENFDENLPDKSIVSKMNDGHTNFLFVGRVVPNKNFEGIIKTFAIYHKTINSNSRLTLIGDTNVLPSYYNYLLQLIREYSLQDKVHFTGNVSLNELMAYYKTAHVFLCLSHHEGFCIPVIESMRFKIPVFALSKGAITETLGNSGILIKEENYHKISELINYVLNSPDIQTQIIKKQTERLGFFSKERFDANLKAVLSFLNPKIVQK
ncbi:MAG: hypothetical protein ACD_79C00726G0002 [uncultured bacterium]|nr:MAG: hypothetical protein ACD_79C00726G0002 [uncultured bacterium]